MGSPILNSIGAIYTVSNTSEEWAGCLLGLKESALTTCQVPVCPMGLLEPVPDIVAQVQEAQCEACRLREVYGYSRGLLHQSHTF